MSESRCEQINEGAEIHYWTDETEGAPCECGRKARPTAGERAAAKAAAFAEWFRSLATN